MLTKRLTTLVLLTLLLPAQMACAGIGDDLKRFGFESNYTSPKAYESQAGGHYSGGSLFARTPVRNCQLMHVDIPSLRSGCGNRRIKDAIATKSLKQPSLYSALKPHWVSSSLKPFLGDC